MATVDCSLVDDATAAPPDVDIVGIGALVNFLSIAVVGFLTLIAAYWTDSLPSNRVQRQLWLDARAARGMKIPERDDGTRLLRVKAFQTFMTALSDQQLAMGSAILISGLARYRAITTYSINIVIDLAYFAASVHLTLLPMLEPQLYGHLLLKSVRTAVMVVCLIMLLFLMGLQLAWYSSALYQRVYLQCVIPEWPSVPWPRESMFDTLANVQVMLMVVVIYMDGLIALWASVYSGLSDMLLARWLRLLKVGSQDLVTYLTRLHRDKINALPHRKSATVLARLYSESWGFYYSVTCVESTIVWLSLIIVYGITQVVIDRESLSNNRGLNEMGFGQVVPIVLLILPFITALQAYDDFRDARQMLETKQNISSCTHCQTDDLCTQCAQQRQMTRALTNISLQRAPTWTVVLDRGLTSDPPAIDHQADSNVIVGVHRAHSLDQNRTQTLDDPGSDPASTPMKKARTFPAIVPEWFDRGKTNPLSIKSVRFWAWLWLVLQGILAVFTGIVLGIGGSGYLVSLVLTSLLTGRGLLVTLMHFWRAFKIRPSRRTNDGQNSLKPTRKDLNKTNTANQREHKTREPQTTAQDEE